MSNDALLAMMSPGDGLERSFWLPKAASTVAEKTDNLFMFITWLDALFFIGIVGFTVYYMLKYRRKRAEQKTSPVEGNFKLELVWSVIPSIILVVLFMWGFRDWMDLNVPPAESLDVRVVAKKWNWQFIYPSYNNCSSKDLYVPEGKSVKLTMTSEDVLHSFYVPAFRVKKDLVPERYTVVWFEAKKNTNHKKKDGRVQPIEYDVLCTEYCGNGHHRMLARVKTLPKEAFERQAKNCFMTGPQKGPDFGKFLFESNGCNACHDVSKAKKKMTGPPLFGKYGTMEPLVDGSQAKVDDAYIEESIKYPNRKVVKGYAPAMPTYKGSLNKVKIMAIIDYMKSLK